MKTQGYLAPKVMFCREIQEEALSNIHGLFKFLKSIIF